MNKIALITTTYNRGQLLQSLYRSLLSQIDHRFDWIIIDDGSKDDTEALVKRFQDENNIHIQYQKKENGGKASAINVALELLEENVLAVIVDDDEVLSNDAVEIAYQYYHKYYLRDNIGIIHFQRRNKKTGKLFANYDVNHDLKYSYWDFLKRGYFCDGYLAFFGYAIKGCRFPLFPGEKYVGPSVLIMRCNDLYNMVWASAVLGVTEYLDDGITRQGRKLRLKNPCGMLCDCLLRQRREAGLKIRLKYSSAGYAYRRISRLSERDLKERGLDTSKLNKLMRVPGELLYHIWMRRYLTGESENG